VPPELNLYNAKRRAELDSVNLSSENPPMTTREVKSGGYHHGSLRKALVDAGIRVLSRDGADAVTLRAVAREAGVSHAAPYSHFKDREALLAAVAVPSFRELARRLRDAVAGETGDAGDRIRAAGRAYLGFAIDRPEEYRLMFGPRVGSFEAHEGLGSASRDAFGVLVAAVEAGQAAGLVSPGPSTGLATFAWAAVHGLASLFVDRRVDVSDGTVRDHLVASLTGLILDGLRIRV
jgi:AcrR family transcriptional regulator